jgi:dTDP-glucose 4,6-dehydratase
MKLLVTGGCGFIGSNFIRFMLETHPDFEIVNLDALTYAGNPENLKDVETNPRYRFVLGRIEDADMVRTAMKGVESVVHFAAESHVDRSILDAQPFLKTNILGTHLLFDIAREYGISRFIHISTDEVYGTLGDSGKFTEETPLRPNSPYSASKAAADLLARAYYETYKLPVILIRPSNNYGPYQYPEKFIPLMITNLLTDKSIPVYGRGENIRDWLYVEDNCRAIDLILHKGRPGEAYNVGGRSEVKNIELARQVLAHMGRGESDIQYVKDRPGHDYRYALDISRMENELGWKPLVGIEEGIEKTVRWYKKNEQWWRSLKERLLHESRGFWQK